MTRKIVALVGSPRKKETWRTVELFEAALRKELPVEFEYVFLKDLNLQQCRGCFLCLTKGDEFCPLKDDRELVVGKLMAADGVIFATPNYALSVTAIMKNLLDRIAYTFHRPCFFNKRSMAIVTQGAIGAGKIVKYFRDVATFTGFTHVPGLALTTVSPRTADEQAKIDSGVSSAAIRYAKALKRPDNPKPSITQVATFRIVRSMYRTTPDDSLKDVRYYRNNGWFTSGYFYPVKLGLLRSAVGLLVDLLGRQLALKRKQALLQGATGK